jgi:hypothetical protein
MVWDETTQIWEMDPSAPKDPMATPKGAKNVHELGMAGTGVIITMSRVMHIRHNIFALCT